MWFKQLSFYRLSENSIPSTEKLSEVLEKRPFSHCMGLDWFSEGWVPPAGFLVDPVYPVRDCLMVALKREDKVLPAGVIRDFLDAKISEIENTELRKIGRKEKLELKEQITDDLLPRAFTRSGRLTAYLDTRRQWLMVDSGTASKAEALVSQLRDALPPFPAALPRTKLAPHTAMTSWVADGEAPHGFELDAECELKDPGENGAIIRCTRMDLTSDDIKQHIANGMLVTRVGLIWRERVRFVLTDALQLKRIQFLDVLQEEASGAGDDMESLFEATFILMSEELGDIVEALVESLDGLTDEQMEATSQPAATPASPAASHTPSAAGSGDDDVPWN
ncbi:recombination-associated protein RdgC [Craterilacuibacter sp. RT1T]|uniref:recombination-associated protein RdgC n=1 Tax=Craterilacuibacter sp. RT1T TaxID=2942211 RepID=UPI0020BDFD67|nr:recombination-associated protein RdgC [Craterilacuibacter sp. RT1T]MCL6262197.1 recombination-associated protein RdgC [Craterilacuibacter sp. RT1T]